jgi:formate dehydrogenase alpha subunit
MSCEPKEIQLTIDGQEVIAREGTSVLDAALANDIFIPHLCHHPDLKPVGACRLCGVEIDGGRMTMSCVASVQEGMDVKTDSPGIHQARKTALELLIADHHMDCLACAAANDCALLDASAYLGIQPDRLERLRHSDKGLPIDASNPFFQFDPNKCVVCGICVRTCDEIVGRGTLDFIDRGFRTVIGTFANKPFIESTCESCGECVVRCPVGALAPKVPKVAAREVQTTCVYCGVGCGIYLGVAGDKVVNVRADRERPTNEGSLCVKGRYGFNFINHSDRLTKPLIKKNGEFVEAEWDEALELVASKFAERKGDQFAALASAKCVNEENYLIQKFTRAVMETNTVDHCARL